MPRQNYSGIVQGRGGFIMPCKIRKRGCSSSSSSSSVIQNYRFKKAILGKKKPGSITPAPSWSRIRSPLVVPESPMPKQPVSARKLAATLWEMNGVRPSPSPKLVHSNKDAQKRERRLPGSGSLPPHLSDPSHSPVSERMERSGTGSRRGKMSSVLHRQTDYNVVNFDSISRHTHYMEIETRSRAPTPSGSVVSVKARLKDVSNALVTSKELLKIINRIWSNDNQPSSSMSLISALYTELERARLQVNQLIQEQRSDTTDVNFLMKQFAEEKAAWKSQERKVVETAIDSIAGELEVEKKLRRRFESLNKKLGGELAKTKASLLKALKELEGEKRVRLIMEQVCDEMAGNLGDDKVVVEDLKRESEKALEEVEREREMLRVADMLREERVQMKLSEAKRQLEEKNAAVDKLKDELESILKSKTIKEKGRSSLSRGSEADIAAYLNGNLFASHHGENIDDGELEDAVNSEQDSAESDLHSIELNMDNINKSYKWSNAYRAARDAKKVPFNEDGKKGRKSVTSGIPSRSNLLQRSFSDSVEWHALTDAAVNSGRRLDRERFSDCQKQEPREDHKEEIPKHKSVRNVREQISSNSGTGSARLFSSPTRQWGQSRPPREPHNVTHERHALQATGSKLRPMEVRSQGQIARRSIH